MISLQVGNVYTKVLFKKGVPAKQQRDVLDLLKDNLKYPNSYWSAVTNEYIDGYTYLITPKGRVATGLIGYVTFLLKAANLEFQIDDRQEPVPTPDNAAIIRRIKRLKYKPRPYQMDAIFEGIQMRRGMFDMATGAGKSIVMAALLAVWDLPTLVVVDSTDLARQLREDLSDIMGEPVGLIGSGVWDEERVTVAMVQSLTKSKAASKKGKKIREFLKTRRHIVFDEVHHAQARTWRDVSKMCSKAPVRHGMSGTCFSSEVMIENGQRVTTKDSLLVAHTGQVIYKIRADQLIDMGYLSRPKVLLIQNRLYEDGVKLQPADEYARIIMEDEYRNNAAAKLSTEAYDKDGQVIVFVNRIDHGETFRDLLINKYNVDPSDVIFLSGRDDKIYRKEVIRDFKSGKLPIIIGTVLGEGLNFYPTLGVNLGAGQSKKDVIQRLGRVLRKPPSTTGDVDIEKENEVTFVDFIDYGHKWYERHGQARLDTYIEQGHKVEAVHYIEGQLLESTVEKLDISGANLKKIYRAFEDTYRGQVGTWAWKAGDKPRIKKLFVALTEALNIRENDKFDDAIDAFNEYVARGTKAWLNWDKSTPLNYIGFLANKNSVEVYAAKKLVGPSADIAGTAGDDYWEW